MFHPEIQLCKDFSTAKTPQDIQALADKAHVKQFFTGAIYGNFYERFQLDDLQCGCSLRGARNF